MSMTTVTLPDLTTTMDPSTDPSVIDRLESFLYTPMGVGTLAGVTVVITSLIWLVGCCVYCCCRWRRSSEEGGVTVANRDLMFLDIGPTEPVHNGTMSSGYNTGPQPYTTSNSYNNPMARNGSTAMLHTSLDSVISVDRYWHNWCKHIVLSLHTMPYVFHFAIINYGIISPVNCAIFCVTTSLAVYTCTAFLLHILYQYISP